MSDDPVYAVFRLIGGHTGVSSLTFSRMGALGALAPAAGFAASGAALLAGGDAGAFFDAAGGLVYRTCQHCGPRTEWG